MKLFMRNHTPKSQRSGRRQKLYGPRQATRADHPLYGIWKGLRNRCNSPSNKDYPNYGGRGLSVSAEWDDFDQFCKDMGPRPSPIHSIDRIDNDLGYSASNCRWATPSEQQMNTRATL